MAQILRILTKNNHIFFVPKDAQCSETYLEEFFAIFSFGDMAITNSKTKRINFYNDSVFFAETEKKN